jgi:hypothetical protein
MDHPWFDELAVMRAKEVKQKAMPTASSDAENA